MSTTSFAWEGEDILIRKLMLDLFGIERGFYVDIGAHHPLNLSNTHLLHTLGWRGVNVDATPGSMALFEQWRSADINLELAVSDAPGKMLFTLFEDPELNGFVDENTVQYHESRGAKVVKRIEIDCVPLNTIFDQYVKDRDIDVLSIDVEGMDLRILEAANLEKWRPKMIIIEVPTCFDIESVMASPVYDFFRKRDYALFSRLHFSCFFIDIRHYDGRPSWHVPADQRPRLIAKSMKRKARTLLPRILRRLRRMLGIGGVVQSNAAADHKGESKS